MAIIVLQHWDIGGPGRLGLTLRDHGFKIDLRRPDRDGARAIPTSFESVEGVVVLGGPQNVCDADFARDPWLTREVEFLRDAHTRNLPVLGVCLGAQLIAHALGGKVTRMDQPEIGLLPVKIGVAGQTETLLAGLPWEHPQFHSHGWSITAPPGASVLASTAAAPVQAFKVGVRTYGFQFHFECDRPMIESYMKHSVREQGYAGPSAEQVVTQCDKGYERFARAADRLCVNIATYLFPMSVRSIA